MQFKLAKKDVNGSLVLDIGSSNANLRGHVYLNGVDLGRIWGVVQGSGPVQRYYYLPLDVARASGNRLTIVRATLLLLSCVAAQQCLLTRVAKLTVTL